MVHVYHGHEKMSVWKTPNTIIILRDIYSFNFLYSDPYGALGGGVLVNFSEGWAQGPE